MKVLGVDPGMALLGWSVLTAAPSSQQEISYGCISTESNLPLTIRLTQIYDDFKGLIEHHRPHVIALETLFFVKNAKTLAQVGHVRGIILLLAGQMNISVYEYAPRQIKMALTGYGGADKRQIQTMVQKMLNLSKIPTPDDAADAVAVALCHLQYNQTMGKSAVTV